LSGRVARIKELKCAYKILVGRLEGRYHFEDVGVDLKIILKWILNV